MTNHIFPSPKLIKKKIQELEINPLRRPSDQTIELVFRGLLPYFFDRESFATSLGSITATELSAFIRGYLAGFGDEEFPVKLLCAGVINLTNIYQENSWSCLPEYEVLQKILSLAIEIANHSTKYDRTVKPGYWRNRWVAQTV